MTETQPFEFETLKRAKFTEGLQQNDMASELDASQVAVAGQGYVPLWQQVKESFQLRPDDDSKDITRLENMLNPSSGQVDQIKLTKPVAPTLATEERSQMKDVLDGKSQLSNEAAESANFKAMPLNKRIFERPSRLPEVPKKEKTDFQECSLSQTNRKIGTIQPEQSNPEFKALPLNKKIL